MARKFGILLETRGTDLTPEDQAEVLESFTNRYTGDHKPQWAENGNYPVQFRSDKEWLENTFFKTRKDGRLDQRHQHCESFPTWPENPEHRR